MPSNGRRDLELSHRHHALSVHRLTTLWWLLLLCLTPLSARAEVFNEYDLLLLDFTLERQRLAQVVTAYSHNDSIFVSLSEASAALEFSIVVDAASGRAHGWFLDKRRRFELDIKAATVTIEGNSQPLSPADAIVYEQAIYVPIDLFSRWFPVELTPHLMTMSVEVSPQELLPVQLRAQRRKMSGQRFVLAPPSLPEVEQPYRLLGSHSADLFLGYHIRRETDEQGDISAPQTSLTHSTLVRGDLAYMTSAIYLGGNDVEPLSYARMTLSRRAPDTPRGVTLIELGDITPELVRGALQNSIERGFMVAGSTAKGADLYSLDGNRTYISGDVLEGWEVELLHNGVRIDYQVIGAEGRYDFQNLDLYNGLNTFELIFYGPAGEQRSEIITRYGGANSIRKGALNYRFSTSQKGRTLYESPADIITIGALTDRGSLRYSGRLEYGLFSNLSVSTAWNSVVEDGNRLDYYSVGFRAGFRNISISLDATNDPLGGTIVDGVINLPATLRLWGFNTRFQHTQYANSVIAQDETYETQISSRSSVILTGSFGKISSRLAAAYNDLEGRSTTIYSADVSRSTATFRLGNTLSYQVVDSAPQLGRSDLFEGNVYFNSMLDPLTLRGNVNYQLQPDSKPQQYQLNADLRVASDMGMKFDLEYTPNNELTRYTASLSWRLDFVTLTPRLTYDSEGRYSGFVFASFSLAPKPDRRGVLVKSQLMANTGAVASRVFFDYDNDGKFSETDKPLEDVSIYAPQLFRHVETDEQGVAYLTGLRLNKTTDIELDQNSLPGLSMYSPFAGNSVRPRPGSWALIDFPVVATAEIDGILYQQHGESRRPLPGMMVELRSETGELVDFKVSGYDGFFLFDVVPFGRYRVTVSQENRARLIEPATLLSMDKTNLLQSIELVISAATTEPATLFPSWAESTERALVMPPIMQSAASPENDAGGLVKRTDRYVLQLGAYRTQAAADRAIRQLRQRFERLLQGLNFEVKRSSSGARGGYFRVYAKGDMKVADAKSRCRLFSQRGQGCLAVPLSRLKGAP